MVASAEPQISTKKPKQRGRGAIPNIDIFTRSKARNLYVIRHLGAQEVATQCGLTVPQVYSLAARQGWTKARAQIREKENEASRSREDGDIAELVEAVAVKSQLLSLGTLDSAIEELKAPGEFQAKNLQALSVAAKNFVGLYRQAKQLDTQASDANASQINVMFVGQLPRKEERNVTPNPIQTLSVTPEATVTPPTTV